MNIFKTANNSYTDNHDEYEIKFDNYANKYIDSLLSNKLVDYGTHFYLKEIYLCYRRMQKEVDCLSKSDYKNEYKINAIKRVITNCEIVLENYKILSKTKTALAPRKIEKLLKRQPIIAYNLIK